MIHFSTGGLLVRSVSCAAPPPRPFFPFLVFKVTSTPKSVFKGNVVHFCVRTRFNSVSQMFYVRDMIESRPAYLFLWVKYECCEINLGRDFMWVIIGVLRLVQLRRSVFRRCCVSFR